MFSDPQKNVEQFGLMPGAKVADLGAGSGHYVFAAARIVGPKGKVYAVDVHSDLLDRILNTAHTQHLQNVEVVRGNIEKVGGTPFREGSLDAVIVSNVLFQLDDRDGLVNEVRRILKPGGRVLVVDWSTSGALAGAAPANALGEMQARDLFERGGLQYDKQISAGQHHYGLIYRKP